MGSGAKKVCDFNMKSKTEKEQDPWDTRCAVCGKSVEQGGGFCHINIENRMVALCCPLCMDTFQKDPKQYMRMEEIHKLEEAIKAGKHPD